MLKSLLPDRPGTGPLAEAFRACRVHFVGAAVFSALINLLYLTPTLYMMQVYDRVVPTGGLTTLVLMTAVALFALACLAVLDWLRSRLLLRAGLRLDRLLSTKILARVVNLQTRSPNTHALREFDNVRSAVAGPGALALFDAPWTPLYLACCFLLHPAIGVLTLVGGLILFALAWLNERDSRARLAKAIQSNVAAYAAQESIAAQAEVVRALGMRKASIANQIEQRRSAVAQQADAQLQGGRYSGAIKFVRLALQSAALGLAAYLVVKGQISPGSIIASSVLLSRAVAPVELLVGAWPGLVQARSSWSQLVELFAQTADEDRPRTALPRPAGRFEAEGVTVRLPEVEKPLIQNVRFALQPGRTLGVIGASGSGKTTLARVVSGSLKPTTGVVRLDGAEYDARDGDDLAQHIGYLPQVPSLFAGSIRDNISRFAAATGLEKSAVDQAAVNAAMAAGAHDMIQRLPDGYDTVLTEDGGSLSQGEKQLLCITRVMLSIPPMLILDEATSSIDTRTEQRIQRAFEKLMRGRTSFIVAHRLSTIQNADMILVMNAGNVVEQGTHEELLQKGGFYAKLYNSQFAA